MILTKIPITEAPHCIDGVAHADETIPQALTRICCLEAHEGIPMQAADGVNLDVTHCLDFDRLQWRWLVHGCPFVARAGDPVRVGRRVVAMFRVGVEGSL